LKWEDQQSRNEELQHERDEEYKKGMEAENRLLEEKQVNLENQIRLDKIKMEEAQKRLEGEKNALEEERLRVYDSGLSSRAGIGHKPEVKSDSPKPRRRRRQNYKETKGNSRKSRKSRKSRRGQPEVGRVSLPDFDKITSKIGSRENCTYKQHKAK
jgi:hypothetical protein